MASKYYAVRKGIKEGIYSSWDECSKNVKGVKGAQYKSFLTMQEAQEYMKNTIKETTSNELDMSRTYSFVDGSFNIATGVYGYGGFLVHQGKKYLITGSGKDIEMASMRNVAGEILGSMAAIKKAIELGIDEIDIYYDYMGIQMWATGEWKRNKKGTVEYYDFIKNVENKIKINFIKVKGHSGIEGNEEADILAKKAVGINN